MNDLDEILENDLVFRKSPKEQEDDGKVKTEAKKKQYVAGAHGSGLARQKAKYRQQRANRNKKR